MPVPGLRIYVKPPTGSTQKGTWVSTDGRAFRADNLLPGNYTLVVHFGNCCGFTQDVLIRAGRVNVVRIDLSRYYAEMFSAQLAKATLTDLTIASDGTKWFVEYLGPVVRIAHVDAGGLHEFDLPSLPVNSPVSSLTPRADGSLWFTDGEKLERINADGHLQTLAAFPERIDQFAIGPDGSVWTSRMQGSGVTRYVPATGKMHTFELPPANPGQENARLSITRDGTAWYTSLATNSITRLSGGARVSTLPLPWKCGPHLVREWQGRLIFTCWNGKYGAGVLEAADMRATPLMIARSDDGPEPFPIELDGEQWFIGPRHLALVGVAANGTTRKVTLKSPLDAFGLAAANHRLWYVDGATYDIISVALDGSVTRYHIPGAHKDPETNMGPIDELVPDSDGNVWFLVRTDFALYRIARNGTLSRMPVAPKPVEMPH